MSRPDQPRPACGCSACVPAPPDPDGSPHLDAAYLHRLAKLPLRAPDALPDAQAQARNQHAEIRKLVKEVERLRTGLRAIAGMESVEIEDHDASDPADLAWGVLHGYPMWRTS